MEAGKIDPSEVRFFSGSSNEPLARRIANYLGVPLDPTKISRFSNDNLFIQLGASVRCRKVFIIQSLSPPANEHLMELLMMLDIARGASADEIHAVIPYFSYARSDKKDAPRISITARLVAELLETAGATHAMCMMLHSPQVHGFFGIPVDPLSSRPALEHHFRSRDLSDTIVISVDMGHAKSAARFARNLDLPVAAGDKERVSDTEVVINGIIGAPVRGRKRALIFDDEIANGGSILTMSGLLIEQGIEEIWVACTHGVFTRGALARLSSVRQITEIVTTDTVFIPDDQRTDKLSIVSVAPTFGEAIRRNYMHQSIGSLFVYGEDRT
ncbi:MAG: ribose-phosphate pyrophosphokinase [Chloroflexi bacterium]|nr:ribose-phosphate pyrophosphokinase [Chloroflexota bacterium]